MSYATLVSQIFSVFDSAAWKALAIQVFPDNYVAAAEKEFLRLNILIGGEGVNLYSSSGTLIIDVFTEANVGPMRALQIADHLDTFLVGTYKDNSGWSLQLFNSFFVPIDLDKANPGLFRSKYSINFNYSGVK